MQPLQHAFIFFLPLLSSHYHPHSLSSINATNHSNFRLPYAKELPATFSAFSYSFEPFELCFTSSRTALEDVIVVLHETTKCWDSRVKNTSQRWRATTSLASLRTLSIVGPKPTQSQT